MLKLSKANAKTKALYAVWELERYLRGNRKVYSLDLLSGHSCPGAKECKSMVVEYDGEKTIQDGPNCVFRCFSATQERIFPKVYARRKFNFDLLRYAEGWKKCRDLILMSLPKNCGILRLHVAGDFFKLAYLRGLIAVAEERPDILFYGYTKSLHFLRKVDMLYPAMGVVRQNFLLTASRGGAYDHLISQLGIREAKVVFSEEEAGNLEIDHDDSHAATRGPSFALLLHGTQPKGSKAAKALSTLKGKGSYGRKS